MDLNDKSLFKENSKYDPSSPYSASKASSDYLVRAWHRTYDLPIIITNCSNNYGPYQFPEKFIPLVILNALNKKKYQFMEMVKISVIGYMCMIMLGRSIK